MARNTRKSEAEVALRQTDIRDMLLKGKATSHILAYIGNQYGVARSTIERDITIVYRQLRVYLEKNKDDIISEHIARYDKIYEECMEIMNHKDAMKAMRQKEELLKYHRNEPLIAIQNNTMNLENVSDDKLLKAIEELKNINNGKTS